jgi:predicted NAD/FAD-binding protein
VSRKPEGIEIDAAHGEHLRPDKVVIATHADDAPAR